MLKLSFEKVFGAIDHMLNLLVWMGTRLQFAIIMVYVWTLWLTSLVKNDIDMVDGSTSAVVLQLQSTGSTDPSSVRDYQQIGGLIRDVIGISGESLLLLLIRHCQQFARRGHIEVCGLWIVLRVDLVYWVVLIESRVLAEELYYLMLQECHVGFYWIEDLSDSSLPGCSSEWINCVIMPTCSDRFDRIASVFNLLPRCNELIDRLLLNCSERFDRHESVFDSLLPTCYERITLSIELVVLMLQKCNEWISTKIGNNVDVSSWTPWFCKGSLLTWISHLVHKVL